MQLEYRVGSIPLSVTVEVSGRLNDDTWHSVLVERNRKQARLLVDNALRSEVDEPAGPVRSIQLSSKLVVGTYPLQGGLQLPDGDDSQPLAQSQKDWMK